MSRRWSWMLGIGLVGGAVASAGSPAKANVITLVVTGDNGGEIAPCG